MSTQHKPESLDLEFLKTASNKRFAIVYSEWNSEIIDRLVKGARDAEARVALPAARHLARQAARLAAARAPQLVVEDVGILGAHAQCLQLGHGGALLLLVVHREQRRANALHHVARPLLHAQIPLRRRVVRKGMATRVGAAAAHNLEAAFANRRRGGVAPRSDLPAARQG